MKIAVVGANSPLGKSLVLDAEKEGIQVTSIVSSPQDLVGNGPIIIKECFELTPSELQKFYAVVDAISFAQITKKVFETLPVFSLAPLLKGLPCRYVAFGSCYLLFSDSKRTQRLGESSSMFFIKGDLRASKVLELYHKIQTFKDFKYTLLCPPLTVKEESYPTGKFEFGDDLLPLSLDGSSSITLGDLSLAMVELLKRGLDKPLVSVVNN